VAPYEDLVARSKITFNQPTWVQRPTKDLYPSTRSVSDVFSAQPRRWRLLHSSRITSPLVNELDRFGQLFKLLDTTHYHTHVLFRP